MNKIKSLGLRSDLMLAAHESIIQETDDYLVVKTPSNPGFYWGNFLVFKEPPSVRDAQLGHAKSWEYFFHQTGDMMVNDSLSQEMVDEFLNLNILNNQNKGYI